MSFVRSKLHKKNPSVRDLLHKLLTTKEPSRKIPDDKVHASDLTNPEKEFCPREYVLVRHLDMNPLPRPMSPGLRLTFDIGKDTQSRINNEYLRDHMVGDWKCALCGKMVYWTKYPGAMCAGHKSKWVYSEPVFKHPESSASGSMDAFLSLGTGKLTLVECKIINNDQYQKLVAPLAEHRIRTQLYLRIIAESGDPRADEIDTSRGIVLYVLRGYGRKGDDGKISPFKEFVVDRDDLAVHPYIVKATQVHQARQNNTIPVGICPSLFDKRAQNCRCSKECFSGSY